MKGIMMILMMIVYQAGFSGPIADLVIDGEEHSVRVEYPREDTLLSGNEVPFNFADRDKSEKGGFPAVRLMFLDNYAKNAPDYLIDRYLKTLVNYLTKPTRTELEKARVLFTWVATHLEYDVNLIKNPRYEMPSVMTIITGKAGICGDYSCVFDTLCRIAGLESYKISGLSKNEESASTGKYMGHAWNVLKADGKWRLMDVTWASSGLIKKKGDQNSIRRFEPYWFDTDPKEFIFRHFPKQDRWQLLGDSVLNLETFKRLPFLSFEFFKAGFNSKDVLHAALEWDNADFVKVYPLKYAVKTLQAPLHKTLKKGIPVTLTFRSEVAERMWLFDSEDNYEFSRTGNIFSLHYVTENAPVRICIQLCDTCGYNKLLEYEVRP